MYSYANARLRVLVFLYVCVLFMCIVLLLLFVLAGWLAGWLAELLLRSTSARYDMLLCLCHACLPARQPACLLSFSPLSFRFENGEMFLHTNALNGRRSYTHTHTISLRCASCYMWMNDIVFVCVVLAKPPLRAYPSRVDRRGLTARGWCIWFTTSECSGNETICSYTPVHRTDTVWHIMPTGLLCIAHSPYTIAVVVHTRINMQL